MLYIHTVHTYENTNLVIGLFKLLTLKYIGIWLILNAFKYAKSVNIVKKKKDTKTFTTDNGREKSLN